MNSINSYIHIISLVLLIILLIMVTIYYYNITLHNEELL
jgi:hypothetical protein